MHDNATNCAHQCAKGFAPSKDLRSPRPYNTCAARLVAPALNEPYIQYRACKENKLNRYDVLNNMHINVFENTRHRKAGCKHNNAVKAQSSKWSMPSTQATKLIISMRSTQAEQAVYASNGINYK